MIVTASDLYTFTSCPHRVWRDAHDNPAEKDPVNEFVQLLWEKGTQHERRTIAAHAKMFEIVDLSVVPKEQRFARTRDAVQSGAAYIYHARLEVEDLLGEPDLLERQTNGTYWPIDIKSGMGLEGEDDEHDGKLKKHYALQLALYVDALRRLGWSTELRGNIWDSTGAIVEYQLDKSRGARDTTTWWDYYNEVLLEVKNILSGGLRTEAALIGACKLCPWATSCKKQCRDRNDLSLVHELGRSRKEALLTIALDVNTLAAIEVSAVVDAKGKTGIPGVGEKSLDKYVRRAKLLAAGGKSPLILKPFAFPRKPIELYFDIEADPTQDIVYLHGVVERRDGSEVFHSFVADEVSPEAEEKAWSEFWTYVRSMPAEEYAVYYYSKYERTQYRLLSKKYPTTASLDEVESFFNPANAIDLYFDIVLPCTDWPTNNYSVKTLAQLQGFKWRDPNPSGAASIQWFNEWCRDGDPNTLQRILDYNEDDCIAMRVLKDTLEPFADK